MNRLYYPIALMAYGMFLMGAFARAEAGEINYDRNILKDINRITAMVHDAERKNNLNTSTSERTVEGETRTTETGTPTRD